jgi:hypothetical protein
MSASGENRGSLPGSHVPRRASGFSAHVHETRDAAETQPEYFHHAGNNSGPRYFGGVIFRDPMGYRSLTFYPGYVATRGEPSN